MTASPPDDSEGPRITGNTFTGPAAFLHGDQSTQINYFVASGAGTWTDGTGPPPLRTGSGRIESPYRGLLAFDERDAVFFHGRESATAQVLERLAHRLREPGLLVVSGVSGAGKSSLLRAGVLPRLRTAGLTDAAGATAWPCLLTVPGRKPLEELAIGVGALAGVDAASAAQALAEDPARFALLARQAARALPSGGSSGDGPSRRLLLVVDQFEQLFTQCPDERRRQDFVAALHAAATTGGPHETPAALVVLVVRADFEARCADFPQLTAAVQDRYLVTAMTRRQLRMVITEPPKQAGASVDDDLVEVLLNETHPDAPAGASSAAGVLPLLSHALDQAWRIRPRSPHGEVITLSDYERAGGIEGGVAASAQGVYDGLGPERQAVARQVFLRLTATGDDGTVTADRALRSELVHGRSESGARDVDEVLEAFAGRRLLTLAAGTVEIGHEVLLSAWPLLRDEWLAGTQADRIVRTRLRASAAEWERDSRDPSYLYSGSVLETAERAAARIADTPDQQPPLSPAEHDFLQAGLRAHRRSVLRNRVVTITIASVLALVFVFGTLFFFAQRESRDRKARADSQALTQAAQDEASSDPTRSVLLALAAYQTSPTQEARNELLRQYLTYSTTDVTRVLSGLQGPIRQFQTSRDGEVAFATSSLGHAILFVHAAHGTVRGRPLAVKRVSHVMVSPDGRRAGFVADDGTGGWFEVNADAARPIGPVHPLPKVPGWTTYEGDPGRGFAMSPDGRVIVTAAGKNLAWWDLDRAAIGGTIPAPADFAGVLRIAPDDRTLLAETSKQLLRPELHFEAGLVAIDLTTRKTRSVAAGADEVLVSGDRTAVMICRDQGGHTVATVQRVAGGARIGRPYNVGGFSACDSVKAIDATGHRVVVDDGADLSLVDMDRGAVVSTVRSQGAGSDYSADLVAAGGGLLVATHDEAQIVYVRLPSESPGQSGRLEVSKEVLTGDGTKMIALIKGGSRLQLRSVAGDLPLLAEAPLPRPYWDHHVDRLITSRGGLVADRVGRNLVSVREAATLRQTTLIAAAMPPAADDTSSDPQAANFSFVFDQAGNLVTISGTQVQQWDTRTGRQLAHFDAGVFHPKSVNGSLDLSVGTYPSANQVWVIAWGDPVIHVVDLTTGRTTGAVRTTDDAIAVQFDRSGRYFALLRSGSVVELWRRHPLRKEIGPLPSLGSEAFYAAFIDANGRYLVAAHNVIRIYQIGERSYRDSYDFGHPTDSRAQTPYSFVDVSLTGKTALYYQNDDMVGGPLSLDPARWKRELCAIIGDREFTAEDRNSLPVRLPAHRVCA